MATVPSELRHVLLVGPPGSGKGTVGPYLSELLGVPHVSSGQLLRASVTGGDPHHIGEQVNRGHMIPDRIVAQDRKSTRLNSSHEWTSYAVFCLKKKNNQNACLCMYVLISAGYFADHDRKSQS